MFHYGVRGGFVGCLVVFPALRCRPSDASGPPLACRALGLGEGLLVRMLLGVHLFVQEVWGQLVTIVNLQLQCRETI